MFVLLDLNLGNYDYIASIWKIPLLIPFLPSFFPGVTDSCLGIYMVLKKTREFIWICLSILFALWQWLVRHSQVTQSHPVTVLPKDFSGNAEKHLVPPIPSPLSSLSLSRSLSFHTCIQFSIDAKEYFLNNVCWAPSMWKKNLQKFLLWQWASLH